MYCTAATASALLAMVVSVHAVPMPQASGSTPPPTPSEVSGAGNAPFTYPLSNGFPATNLSSNVIDDIEEVAQGTLPNVPLPATLFPDDITSLELIAFNEIFEVAFYTEFLYNVTKNVTGYDVGNPSDYEELVEALTVGQAQEQLHALYANDAVAQYGQRSIEPCQYNFPVSNWTEAVGLAMLFTDVVLGTLANIQFHLAENGDAGLVPAIGSVIGQEGEQNGFFREALGLVPSALPFLTAGSRDFAFSALNQAFVVPGSCAATVAQINLTIFPALSIEPATPGAETQNLTFTAASSADLSSVKALVYINQQNVPVVFNTTADSSGSVTVNFPYEQYEMNGLTIAALVKSTGPFANADAVAAATVAGPAFIEIN